MAWSRARTYQGVIIQPLDWERYVSSRKAVAHLGGNCRRTWANCRGSTQTILSRDALEKRAGP